MISKNNQYLKKWPAGIIEIVKVARIVWNVEDPCSTQLQQDSQCARNVTLRRVPATIVVVEKQNLLHILSVCL